MVAAASLISVVETRKRKIGLTDMAIALQTAGTTHPTLMLSGQRTIRPRVALPQASDRSAVIASVGSEPCAMMNA
jgi:hypothetical protein